MSLFSISPNKHRGQQLQRLVPLNTLSDDALARLVEHVEFKKFKSGDYVFHEGDNLPLNVYLLSGNVTLMVQGREESRVVAGSVVSKFPLAHQVPRQFSVRALNDVEVALIDRKHLDETLGQSDSVDYEVDELSRLGSQDWMEKLLESRPFQGLSADNIPKVLVNIEEMLVFSGDEVITRGKSNDFFYMIHEGRAVVTKQTEDGAGTIELEQLVPGDTFGGDILLAAEPSNVNISMATNGILLRLGKDIFTQLVFMPLIKEISYTEADTRIAEDTQWVDVRGEEGHIHGHIPGSINIPFNSVREQRAKLSSVRHCIVYGKSGREILSAAFALIELGFEVLLLRDGLKSVPPNTLVQGEQTPADTPPVVAQPHQPKPIEHKESRTDANDQSELQQIRLEKTKSRLKTQTEALEKLKGQHKNAAELWAKERGLLKESLVKTKSQLESANQQLESDRALIKQLYQDKDAAVTSMEKAEAQLQQNHQQIEELQTEKEIETQGLSGVTEELDQQNLMLASLKEQLEATKTERDGVRSDLEIKTKQLQQQEADLSAAKSEQENISQRLEELSLEHDNRLQLEQERAQTRRQELEQQLQAAKDELETVKNRSEVDTSASEISALTANLKKAEQQIALQETENGRLREELDSLKGAPMGDGASLSAGSSAEALDAMRVEMDVVKTQAAMEKEELEKALKDLKATLQVDEGLDTQVQVQELDELRRQSEGWEKQVEETNLHCQQLEDSLEDRNEQIQQLENRLTEAQLLHREVKLELDRMQQEASDSGAPQDDPSPDYMEQPVVYGDKPSMLRPFLTGTLSGVLLLFVSLEVISLVSGKGELFTALIADTIQRQLPVGNEVVEEQQTEPVQKVVVEEKLQESVPTKMVETQQEQKTESADKQSKPSQTGTLLDDAAEGPTMIRIDGAKFTMGSDVDRLIKNEQPAHKVTLSAFAVSRSEVTFEEYDRFAKAEGREQPNDNGWGRGQRPVINVSWQDAVAYTRWLSEQTGESYRLPTEAEWEYVAQGGSETTYWWGYATGKGDANCFDCGSQWDKTSTAPVASFKANGYGLHNTAGNVREWVQDCYHKNYKGAPVDGSAWEEPECGERIIRGGSYDKPSKTMISTSRVRLEAKTRLPNVGFRVARDL